VQRSDPITATSLDAVSGCTRALAESADTDVAFASIEGGNVGSLRALGDRAALRQRHQDPALYRQFRPVDAAAATIYDALHLARLDAIGVHWLPGVACNLMAHPGADDGAVRWLAFEVFSERPAPPERAAPTARARAALTTSLLASLRELAGTVAEYPGFAAAAADWSRAAAPHLATLAETGIAPPVPFPFRKPGSDVRRGRYALPGSKKRGDEGDARRDDLGSSQSPADDPADPVAGARPYHAYSTAWDRVVTAAALAGRDELALLRQKLEADMASTRVVVARLAKRLMRVLMAKQLREWQFDLDEGLLDSSRLAPFVASRGTTRPFKLEFDSPFPSTAVTLLIDHSGSMRGRPMQIAAMTVEVFARVLERCGVTCEILGFTTRDWDGGEPARQWAADGYPEQPGRLNALEHIVIKPADVPWRRARVALGLFLRDEMLKENIDGEALAWAHGRLLARPERRRILVVVSDGTPMDEATFAANGYDYLDGHLLSVVHAIEDAAVARRPASDGRVPVQLAAIGIAHDVSRFYRNATRIQKVDDLGPALSEKLIALLRGT
jgi:cobaltochelatase CobT